MASATDSEHRVVFGEERRQRILTLVKENGRVRVRELAAMVGVTETTVRKDIANLDRARLLRRTHGGAIAVQPSLEPDLAERADLAASAKEAIARRCLLEVEDGDAIFLDSGTTTTAIARVFSNAADQLTGTKIPRDVNVLTNAIGVAAELARVGTVRHTMVGGQYRPLAGSLSGPLAVESLQQFTLNTAFIGVSGVDSAGFWVADTMESQVKRTAMDQARRVIVAMDSSKVGHSDFTRLCGVNRVDVIITDRSNETLDRICSEAGVLVVVAV